MLKKCILLALLFMGQAVLAQSAGSAQKDDNPKPKETDAPAKSAPEKSDPVGAVATTGLNQNVVPASDLSNSELLMRARTVYVSADTIFVKREDMEKSLLHQKELDERKLHVVHDKQNADLVLQIKRVPFTNKFPFTLTDRVSSIVLMDGQVDEFPSKVPEKIAAQIAARLEEVYKAKQSSK